MKVDTKLQQNTKTSGGLSEVKFRIEEDAMKVFFKTFSDSIYSNKVGSIVREITSNAYDANIESGTEMPVEVEIREEDPLSPGAATVRIRDYGIGLSPERLQETYSVYFKSTKRDTDKEIGGFGIGAKSPLSYVDSFTILTNVKGTFYHYVIFKGEEAPTIQLMDEDTTSEPDGTTVIIPIKSGDSYEFRNEMESQLRFFDNINYTNCNISNDYQIVRGDNFILRLEDGEVSRHRGHGIEASVGKVAYPLDLQQLKSKKAIPYDIYEWDFDLSLLFDIGELSVTVNRETLEYNEKTVTAITEKFKALRKELEGLTTEVPEFDDLFAYIRHNNLDNRSILIDDQWEVGVGGVVSRKQAVFKPFGKTTVTLGSLNGSPIHPDGVLKEGKKTKRPVRDIYFGHRTLINLLSSNQYTFFRVRDAVSKRKSLYIEETHVEPDSDAMVLRWDDSSWTANDHAGLATVLPTLKGKKAIEFYNNTLKPEILKALAKHSKSYDDIEVPQDWLDAYIEALKSASLNNKYSSKDQITIRRCEVQEDHSGWQDKAFEFNIDTRSVAETQKLLVKSPFFIYGTNLDTDKLGMIKLFLTRIRDYHPYKSNSKDVPVIKVAKDNVKYIEDLPGAYTIDKFMEKFRNRINQVYLAQIMYKDRWVFTQLDEYSYLLPTKVKALADDLHRFRNTVQRYEIDRMGDEFRDSVEDFLTTYITEDYKDTTFTFKKEGTTDRTIFVYEVFQALMAWVNKLPLLRYLDVSLGALVEPTPTTIVAGVQLYDAMKTVNVKTTRWSHYTDLSTGKTLLSPYNLALDFQKYVHTMHKTTLNYE